MILTIVLDANLAGQEEAGKIKKRFSNLLMDQVGDTIKIIVPEANTVLAELVLKWWDESSVYRSMSLETEES